MLKCKTDRIITQFQGVRLEYEKITILMRGANMLKDKRELILYLLDNLTQEYEKKLACLTQEILRKDCEHEDILTQEKQNIIIALKSIYDAIDNIQIAEGMINNEKNSDIQRA